VLYLGGDSHRTDDVCSEDSAGCTLVGDGTGWGNGSLSGPFRIYLECYRHTINRIALCIMHTDDDFGCFSVKGCRRCDEGEEIPRWYGGADTRWSTGRTTHQQDDREEH
jgi:hypothetical protein